MGTSPWLLRPTVSRPVPLGVGPLLGPMTRFNFLYSTITFFLLHVWRPLWREGGSIICSAITQWLESPKTHNHMLLIHLTLPQPGRPGPRIYIPQEQDDPVISPGTGFPFRRLLQLAGLRRRYFNPSLHGACRLLNVSKSKSKLYYDRRSVG
jgi:hypothetical protein